MNDPDKIERPKFVEWAERNYFDCKWLPLVCQFQDRDTQAAWIGWCAAQPVAPDDDGLYFLQDKRSFVGNCVVWWAKDNKGYTTQIELAHRYTKEEAFKQHKGRETDVPWPCRVVTPYAKLTIDMQDLHKTDYARTTLGMEKRY